MKKIIIAITAMAMVGCQQEKCTDCIQKTTVKLHNSNSVVIQTEESEVVMEICDEKEAEGWHDSISTTEENVGNQGYYRSTRIHTLCD